jgi:LysR family cyn operon transcriptional activator
MELRQLRSFIKAKELLNFTEAAAQLFISQSTLSQQIKQLENDLGTPLFNRVGKHVSLTEAGSLFYEYALQCVQKADDGYQVMKDLGDMQVGHLTIGTTYGVRNMLSPAIVAFAKKYPGITIEVVFGTSVELAERLGKFELDFILTFEEIARNPALQYRTLFKSELSLIVRNDSPLARRKSVTLQEIQHLPLALPAKGFWTRRFVDEMFRSHDLHPNISLEINDIPTLLELVAAGRWNTILTKTTVNNKEGFLCIPIKGEPTLQHAVVVTLREVYEKQAVKAFFEILFKKVPN